MAGSEVLSALPDGVDMAIGNGVHSNNGVAVPPWSTIKVPIAIAAFRNDSAAAQPYVAPAITQSSNEAAAQLWASLGDPSRAATLTEQVISEGKSSATVQTKVVRPGFSSFGQSDWSVPEQATFASNLRCIQGSEPVTKYMGQIASGGGYGLGIIPGALFKGGWGPDESGNYGARQFGLVPNGAGKFVAVALAATSPDGTMEGAQARLTEAVKILQPVLGELPTAAC